MPKILQKLDIRKVLKLISAVFSATSLLVVSVHATEAPTDETALKQMVIATDQPSVSQLSDIQPTDWAILTLNSVIERSGCITEYPERTCWGNQALTRYEFATSLNTCLNKVNELVASTIADLITKEDLTTLQRLQEEFAAELAILQGRVDNLEAQTTQLEAQQFSTTTKLKGEIIFAISAAGGKDKADGSGDEVDSNATLNNRARLNFDTSFTGRDRLRVRLQARNIPSFADATGTEMARLGFEGNNDNEVDLSSLEYRLPV